MWRCCIRSLNKIFGAPSRQFLSSDNASRKHTKHRATSVPSIRPVEYRYRTRVPWYSNSWVSNRSVRLAYTSLKTLNQQAYSHNTVQYDIQLQEQQCSNFGRTVSCIIEMTTDSSDTEEQWPSELFPLTRRHRRPCNHWGEGQKQDKWRCAPVCDSPMW